MQKKQLDLLTVDVLNGFYCTRFATYNMIIRIPAGIFLHLCPSNFSSSLDLK